jgi:hypothetical protein
MPLNRSWLSSLIDDDGSGSTGTVWNKSQVSQFHDVIDAGTVPPSAHEASHLQAGSDPIANATTGSNGLLPQLPGGTATFLRGDGTWQVPPGGGGGTAPAAHATTHQTGGSDVVDVKLLGGFPGGTTAFLRGDGTFAVPPGGGGSGDVVGPGSAVSGNLVTFNSTTGKSVADSGIAASSVIRMVAGQVAMTPTANVGVLINGAGVPTNGFLLYVDTGATAGWTGTLLHLGIANAQKMAVDQAGTVQAGANTIRLGNASIIGQPSTDGVVWAHGAVLWLAAVSDVRSLTIYNTTDSSTANMVVSSTGRLARSTSSRRYKTAIEPLTDWRWLLQLQPVTFEPRSAPGTRRFGGLLAEDVATHGPQAHGRPIFAGLDEAGQPDDVAYDHLHAPLIAAVQDLHARLMKLEAGA